MRRSLFIHILSALSAVLLCGAVSRASTGVAISPSEVIAGNLAAGGSYDLFALGGVKWNIQNRGDEAIDMAVSSVDPGGTRIPEGYEPVPDPAWIVPTRANIKDVGPMETATVSVRIELPGGRDYAGKKYAGIIEAKGAPGGAALGLAVSARARILFTIKDEPAGDGSGTEPGAASRHGLTVSTTPYIIDAGTVKPGELHRSGQHLSITNPNDVDIQVRLEQITLDQSQLKTAPGCESLPDGSFLVFENRTVSVPAGETVEVPIYVALPGTGEYGGREFAIVIHTSLAKSGLAVGTYTIVRFKVE